MDYTFNPRRLEAERVAAGMSQRRFSELSGLATQTMYRYEHGKVRVPMEVVLRYCRILRVPINQFLGRP